MPQHRSGPIRNEAARVAILKATAGLFESQGYDRLTVEGIAAQAGVGKQTIYRWWPGKSALIADCLLEGLILPETLTPPNTGDIRKDLATWLDQIFRLRDHPSGEDLMRSLIAAAAENADVGRRLHESIGANSSVIARLQAAVDVSEIRPDAPLEEIGEALVGAVILRALSRKPLPPDAIPRLVAVVLGQAIATDRA